MNKYEAVINLIKPLILAKTRVESLTESVMVNKLRQKLIEHNKLDKDLDEVLAEDDFKLSFHLDKDYKPSMDEIYQLAKAIDKLTVGTVIIGGMKLDVQTN